jgi:hypothetical protein
MTRRELEIATYNDRFHAREAEQKADDLGYAIELLLNDRFKPFYSGITTDNGAHEFLIGIVQNVPISDISRIRRGEPQTESRRIILWKTKFGLAECIGSAYHETEFRSLPAKLDGQACELRGLLEQAIQTLPVQTTESPGLKGPQLVY